MVILFAFKSLSSLGLEILIWVTLGHMSMAKLLFKSEKTAVQFHANKQIHYFGAIYKYKINYTIQYTHDFKVLFSFFPLLLRDVKRAMGQAGMAHLISQAVPTRPTRNFP